MPPQRNMDILKNARRIVVKVGSSTLTYENGHMNFKRIEVIARVLSDIVNSGRDVALVTSGAIAVGTAKMGLDHRPKTTEERQAMAAIGQCELMRIYESFFQNYGHPVGQVLLTRGTVENEVSRRNAINTFNTLFKFGCVPIVNENDTVACDEIEMLDTFGDNDTLSAWVAVMIGADALIILSDIDGLYNSDPRKCPDAKLIHIVETIDDTVMSYAGGAGTDRGTGGLLTKLKAAKIATEAGIPTFILNGEDPEIIYELLDGGCVGTYFKAKPVKNYT
ncbi:MAG TPA: glutamate 5-kinase [Bacillota bacterium]|nr:glutamate 5-kinase [Clostridiales bacterium]HPT85539.1 glutamate 5-kinase [Bacillota bacterium]